MVEKIETDEYFSTLGVLLNDDLNFHEEDSNYSSHTIHSFPAKFPPQLPKKFIENLTSPGDVVLDPMSGSGTTILEAYLLGRRAWAFDIDPLAILISQVKVSSFTENSLKLFCDQIISHAEDVLRNTDNLIKYFESRWDDKSREFIDYWFIQDVQYELLALIQGIETLENSKYQDLFKLIFSSIIIRKSGGVSLALDLAHTRPHKARVVYSEGGKIIYKKELSKAQQKRISYISKTLYSPIQQFRKRVLEISNILSSVEGNFPPHIILGNAQNLPIESNYVDLIVTSPPYASNAIDYMRAHKFSLVWLGYDVDSLGRKRKKYIGGEATSDFLFKNMPHQTRIKVSEISEIDTKRGDVLLRYYSEMKATLLEMYRVLKPGKASIVVVGNSMMKGISTNTAECLKEIGEEVGFAVSEIGIRDLDRDRRMMPAGKEVNGKSQIQQRMHEEYVIGFWKARKGQI